MVREEVSVTVIDHAQLRTTALAYAALAHRRQGGRLKVAGLIEHHRLATQLCELTGAPDVAQAWQRARQVLDDLPQLPTEGQPNQRPSRRHRLVDEPATSSTPTAKPACMACAKPLRKQREMDSGVHKACQLVPCPDCGGTLARRSLVQGRCLPCAAKAAGMVIPVRGFAPATAEQLAALRQIPAQQAAARRAAVRRAVARQTAAQPSSPSTTASPTRRRTRAATPMDVPRRPMWFGRVLHWWTGEPTVRRARYAGGDYVMERIGRRAADQRGIAAGWYLRGPSTAWDHPGIHLAEDVELARRLAEVRIVTGYTAYSDPCAPPTLLTVMRGDVTSELSISGTPTTVAMLPDLDQPVVRVHRHAPLSDQHQGLGGLLGEIRAKIQHPAGDRNAPVIVDWTVHTAAGKAVSTHAGWDDAYAALSSLLDSTPAREAVKDAKCTRCGNHGAHMCGKDWRLANGQIGKRPRGGSVHTVIGGLPGLGRH
jgi:hypothetical protein